ncbi:hypothetical protein B7P43_G07650 [Cryptotermes secundus]|uniref:Uncharacterized protein n=1 Tax=Cryptotermes secundus TaxID=105785 RepID=A0A2J7R2Y5_9NEOP|nr:hypothetical protein B7P43_G07650 [Cryptotermes secundus]
MAVRVLLYGSEAWAVAVRDGSRLQTVHVASVWLYGSEAWTVAVRDGSRLQTAEVHFLRAAEGCTSQDGLKNEDTRKELGVELMQKCNMLQRRLEITHRNKTRANNEMPAKGDTGPVATPGYSSSGRPRIQLQWPPQGTAPVAAPGLEGRQCETGTAGGGGREEEEEEEEQQQQELDCWAIFMCS